MKPFTSCLPEFYNQKVLFPVGALVEPMTIFYKYANKIDFESVWFSFVRAIRRSFRVPPKLRRWLGDQNDSKLAVEYENLEIHFLILSELIA